jgi:uncharacterized protein (TIGR00369 family)
MNFTPRDPDFRKKVEESFSRQKFMDFIHASLVDVQAGYCEIHLPYDERLTQQHGYFHAGVIGTLADNTAGYAAFSLMEADSSVLSVEFKLNLLAPGEGDLLIAKSAVLKSGRTLTVCRSEVYVRRNGTEKLCAAAQSTLIELKNSPDTGS